MSDRIARTLALSLLLVALPAFAQKTLRIAAAADLQPLLPPLLAQFEHETGIHPDASYQSSATLATQIIDGAPFDLFLAADLSFPQRVIDAGRAEEAKPMPYARGTLVLWTRNDSGAPLTLDALRTDAIKTIAIANPEHAPYGRAAVAALKQAGLYDQLKSKLVIGENISQAAQFVQSGSAQAGIVALSLALSPAMKDGHRWLVPENLYPPLDQSVVILKSSANKAAAKAFLEFLRTPDAQSTLSRYGFTLPAGVATKSTKS